jgi:tetratricopeptide (TPR) repeat protein
MTTERKNLEPTLQSSRMSLFDVEKVLERVRNLQPEGDCKMFLSLILSLESRLIFAEEIFDWTDNFTENLLSAPDSQEAQHALGCIGLLWIQYATMEQNLRQWKKAVQVYDDALNDPVASKAVSVYLAYADLCKLRGKISNAQKVYIKGLTANLSASQTDQIWRDFLLTMRESGSPDLTADQLYAAVSSQGAYQSLSKPSSNLLVGLTASAQNDLDEPSTKRIKTENVESVTSPIDKFVSPSKRLTELL